MQITDKIVVSFDYTLTDPDGNTLDSSSGREPLAYLHGFGNIIPGLESALVGKVVGDHLIVDVAPEQAYGLHDGSLVQPVPRSQFPEGMAIEVGMQFQARSPDGQARVVKVIKLDLENITIDANHPLAGMPLKFDVTIREIRPATEEELAHGHVHGAGGHQH